jgi:hypothetical protein
MPAWRQPIGGLLRRNMKPLVQSGFPLRPAGRRRLNPTHLEQIRDSRVARPVTATSRRIQMNGIIYLVGLVVIVLAILSFLGLG